MNIIRFDRLFHRRHHLVDDRHRISLLDHIHTNPNDEQDRHYSNRLRFFARYNNDEIIGWEMKEEPTAMA